MNITSTRRFVCALASALWLMTVAASVSAQTDTSSREEQAKLLSKLWMDTCATHFGSPSDIRGLAKTYGFQQNPPYASALLAGQAGTVWDVSLGPLAQHALVLYEDGRCQVLGRRADSKTISETFEKVLQGMNQPGVSVQRILDKEVDQGGIRFKQVVYFVSKSEATQGWAFASTTTDADAAGMQAVLTIGRTAKPSP
jgi:hypothetical protein